MNKVSLAPNEYISILPETARADMKQLDKTLTSLFGKKERVVWQGKFWGGSDQIIIGYGAFRYTRSDKKPVETFMVGLASQKNYISLYVNAVEDGQYVAKKYADKLGKVKVGASSISFKKLADVHQDTLGKVLNIAKAQQ